VHTKRFIFGSLVAGGVRALIRQVLAWPAPAKPASHRTSYDAIEAYSGNRFWPCTGRHLLRQAKSDYTDPAIWSMLASWMQTATTSIADRIS
jgi:hypothetical protein